MTAIEVQESTVKTAFRNAAKGHAPTPDADQKATAEDRTVHDTVQLSEGGQKIVNLARGADLARDIKGAPVDETFADNLKHATDDVFRITHLFNQTVRSLFGFWK